MRFKEFHLVEKERKSSFEILKNNRIPLDDDERNKAMNANCVWHPGNHDKPICAIWKSKDSNGKIWYCSNTHRAYKKSLTLKGAIKDFEFVKSTA